MDPDVAKQAGAQGLVNQFVHVASIQIFAADLLALRCCHSPTQSFEEASKVGEVP